MAISFLASGCATSTVEWSPHGSLETSPFGGEWDTSIGRMGVAPVVPPSEDIRVGDIFVYSFNPDFPISTAEGRSRLGGLAISPRWATLNLLKELDEEYQLRPAWPRTPDAYLQISEDSKNREWPEARAPQNQGIFAEDSVPDRLRIMGIPEFSTITLTEEGDISALVPTEAVNLVFGSAWNDNKVIMIRMSAAETYSLGLQKVIDAALEDTGQGFALKPPYRDHLALVSDPLSDSVWVRILSDVIYIRSIDIIIQSKSAFEPDEAANANEFVAEIEATVEPVEEALSPEEEDDGEVADEEEAEEAADEVEAMQTVAEILPDHILDPAYTAFVRADAINEILIESDSDDLPGGFMRFISVTDDSAIVRRVWQRGLAIGARGLTLELDKMTRSNLAFK